MNEKPYSSSVCFLWARKVVQIWLFLHSSTVSSFTDIVGSNGFLIPASWCLGLSHSIMFLKSTGPAHLLIPTSWMWQDSRSHNRWYFVRHYWRLRLELILLALPVISQEHKSLCLIPFCLKYLRCFLFLYIKPCLVHPLMSSHSIGPNSNVPSARKSESSQNRQKQSRRVFQMEVYIFSYRLSQYSVHTAIIVYITYYKIFLIFIFLTC